MAQKRLLMVDDDIELCELLGTYLKNEGYNVDFAHHAHTACQMLQQTLNYDLMILDIMMPDQTGLELLQQIRPTTSLPVILLTGRGEDIDRILGLEMGADDYLSKPCNPRELLARIKAVLRRTLANSKPNSSHNQPISLHGIRLTTATREAYIKNQELELTSTEFNVLACLLNSAGQIITKQRLTELVLHRPLVAYDRAIDMHVSRVRQKLANHLDKELIKTIRGQGYLLIGNTE